MDLTSIITDWTGIIIAIIGIGGTLGGHALGVKKERLKWEAQERKEKQLRRIKLIDDIRRILKNDIHGDNPVWIMKQTEMHALTYHFTNMDKFDPEKAGVDYEGWLQELQKQIALLEKDWGII